MATSGTVTYRASANTIINGALRLCLAIDPENTAGPTTNQTSNGLEALNFLVKSWETEGLQLWERKYGVIFPQQGQTTYVLGNPGPGGDNACLSTPIGTGFVQTTAVNAVASGNTSLNLTTITNAATVYATIGTPAITIANGWNIGIQQTSGVMFWTTVSNVVGNVITLASGPTIGSAAGAYVVAYQTQLVRPLRILDGFVRQTTRGNDVPCLIIPRENYNRFGVKTSAGTGIQLYYDPQENTGHLYVYPTTQDVTQQLYIEFQSPIQDFASATNDYDLPQEWGEALKYNLAWRIAPEYGIPKERYDMIKERALLTFSKLDAWDQEAASLYLQPSNWPYLADNSSNK